MIYFAAWLVPAVLVALGQTALETDRRWNRIHALAAATGSAAIFFSGTREALARLMVGGVLVAARLMRVWPRQRRLRAAGMVLGGVSVAAAIAVSPAGEQLRRRWQQWSEDPGGPRTRSLQEAPALVAQNPGLGTGPDTFAAAFRRIESAEMSRTYPDFYHETPHNALLDAACSQGIPGLLVLCGVFGVGFWRRRDRDMLAAAVVGILITSLFASFSLVQVVWLWTLAGVRAAPGSQVRDRAITGLQVPAALLGGTFVVVAAMLAVSDGAWANLARAVQQKEAGRALQEYETAARWGAGFAGYELYASRQLASLGTSLGKSPEAAAAWTQAAVAAERAEKQGEEPFSAAYQSAVLAIARGDLELSERKALLATQMAPKWYKPYLLRAQLMAATGRQREAAEQQDVAIRLGAPKPERR